MIINSNSDNINNLLSAYLSYFVNLFFICLKIMLLIFLKTSGVLFHNDGLVILNCSGLIHMNQLDSKTSFI